MDIVKKNIVSILCGVVALICVVLVFYPFGGMYSGLHKEVMDRKAIGDQLTTIRHQPRTWPSLDPNEQNHIALTHFPTQATVEAGKKMTDSWTQEATDFLNHALSYQVGHMQLLVPGSLPGNGQLTTAFNFADEYRKIFTPRPPAKDGTPAPALGMLRGQLPPTDAEITAQVQANIDYIKSTLPSVVGGKVINQDAVDAAILKTTKDTPIEMRQHTAFKSTVYLDPVLSLQPEARIPAVATNAPSANDIFIAQVGLWVQQEICHAIAETNSVSQRGVLDAPIKRLLSIRPTVPFNAVSLPPGQAAGEPLQVPGLPAAKVPFDFSKNPLGHVSNDFYDVIPFTMQIVCEADTIPTTLTGLTRNRFIMIRSMDVIAVDSTVAQAQGFIYGNKPVVQLNLRCQYLMLRRFLGPYMPQDIIRGLTAQAPQAMQ